MSNRRETGAKGAAAEASKAAKVRRGCWAAGEYVADCHESGELSLVESGERPPPDAGNRATSAF